MTKDKGTELGLSVVLGIVKSHGGGIKCDSTPGRGTVFEILFPAVHGQEESQEAVAEAPLPTGSETILFVDDESMIVNLNTKRLEDLGWPNTWKSRWIYRPWPGPYARCWANSSPHRSEIVLS